MGGPELLEGERVQRVLRASPLGHLGRYGPGLALLAYAMSLIIFFGSAEGLTVPEALDANAGPLARVVLLVFWWTGLAVFLGPFTLRWGRIWPLAYAVVVAVLGGFAAILLSNHAAVEAAGLLGWITLAAVPAPFALAEVGRRAEAWTVTNFRLVRRDGWLKPREEGWRLLRLDRVDVHHHGLRSLDFGDLVFTGKDGEVRIRGVRPATRLRDEVELLLHTSPDPPWLGDQRASAERVSKLLRPGDKPPPPARR